MNTTSTQTETDVRTQYIEALLTRLENPGIFTFGPVDPFRKAFAGSIKKTEDDIRTLEAELTSGELSTWKNYLVLFPEYKSKLLKCAQLRKIEINS